MSKSDDFIKRIYSRRYQSVWTAILGPNQSGKTDLNLYIMERLHALGLAEYFGSNMPLEATDFDIDFIEDFQTLKKRCLMLNPDPERHGIKRYFFFGSEMGKWLPRDQPWVNTEFIKELQLVRKYGLNFLGDGIDRIDARVLNEKHFHGYFEKMSKTNPKIALYNDFLTRRTTTLENIPRTKIKFNTWYSANFYMKPQSVEDKLVPLNPAHQKVKKWLEFGSWRKAGIHQQEGKRAIQDVLRFHMGNCLHSLEEQEDNTTPIEAENPKVQETVT